MDQRKAAILQAIVEQYVASAQPVSSGTITRNRGFGVSAATVRNEMVALEREGYLTQPHTSAGRIPTDKGYRHFVDHTRSDKLGAADVRTISTLFTSAHRALEDILHETSVLLSRVTDHVAVVLGPQTGGAVVRSVQLVEIHTGVVIVVGVLSNGAVCKEILELGDSVDPDVLAQAGGALSRDLVGKTATEVGCALPGEPTPAGRIVDQARAALAERVSATSAEDLYITGAGRIAAESDAFPTQGDAVARLLELLEHQYLVVGLVRDLLDDDLIVRIGSENELAALKECSLVLAPYLLEGKIAGSVGVLGPTRMDYPHTMAAVAAVSGGLGRLLSSG